MKIPRHLAPPSADPAAAYVVAALAAFVAPARTCGAVHCANHPWSRDFTVVIDRHIDDALAAQVCYPRRTPGGVR